jgi:hypothetical protein
MRAEDVPGGDLALTFGDHPMLHANSGHRYAGRAIARCRPPRRRQARSTRAIRSPTLRDPSPGRPSRRDPDVASRRRQ